MKKILVMMIENKFYQDFKFCNAVVPMVLET